MTNAKKYLKDGVSARKLWKKFQAYYFKNKSEESDVEKAFRNFFKQEAKPTLTEDERVILSNIMTDNYKYMHRDGNGCLWVTEDTWLEPKKDPMLNIPYRESDNIFWFGMYRHLFECIGKRRRILNRRIVRR